MCKRKGKTVAKSPSLPLPPWIYVVDTEFPSANALAISELIPHTKISYTTNGQDLISISKHQESASATTTPVIIEGDTSKDVRSKIETANLIRDTCIARGCNFVSVNLYLGDEDTNVDMRKWGTNHLELNISNLNAHEIANKVYKWLFTVLTVPETLHLYTDTEMRAADYLRFPDYAYCPISKSHLRPKDAKIQFVALITSKPEIVAGRKIIWTVADKTGTANFYFNYRNAESQYTWDWVLKLKPGDLKALPRMPYVEVVNEKLITRALKAPFRGAAKTVCGIGHVVKGVGKGFVSVGGSISRSLGQGKEWVPQADTTTDKDGKVAKIKSTVAKAERKKNAGGDKGGIKQASQMQTKILNEKAAKLWTDDDSNASTTHFDDVVVSEKEFF